MGVGLTHTVSRESLMHVMHNMQYGVIFCVILVAPALLSVGL